MKIKPALCAEPILVGRERELEELEQFLNLAVAGKGKTVFVLGEAGSGKTRLAREFLNKARRMGIAVMAGWCLSDAQVPFFPFVEAFNNYYAAFNEEEYPANFHQAQPQLSAGVAQVDMGVQEREISSCLSGPRLSEKPGRPEVLSPSVWKDQAFDAVSKTLRLIAAHDPVILFIEDVHWADSASLALLHYFARAIQDSERVFLLATVRAEELTADFEGHPHPLAETLRVMRREELFTEIKLPNLNPENVSKIAENMIRGNIEQELAEKLTIESRGNPLFIVESLRMLNEQKSLVQENGKWRMDADKLGIPSKIKDIILRRLAVLKYSQRRILDAASVIGEKFDVELLTAVLALDSLEVLETLSMIANSTSLVVEQGNLYKFDHAKSRETIYEALSAPLKRGYHERIAEKLESSNIASPPLSDLAYHFAQSGNEKKAIKYSLAAGQDELARFSNAEALKHFNFVTKAVGEQLEYAKEKEIALEGLGDTLYANNMFKEAMKTFEDLANTIKTGFSSLRAYRKAMDSAFEFGDAVHMNELLQKAQPHAAADRLESARVLMERGRVFAFYNKGAEALKDFQDALHVFEEEYSLEDVAWALSGVGARHPGQGKPDEGIAEILRMVALLEELGSVQKVENGYFMAGFTFNMCMLEPEARRIFVKIIELDDKFKVGGYVNLVFANAFLARSFAQGGNFELALPYALKAFELSEKTDSEPAKGTAYSTLARLYARLGDMEHSEEFFDKLMRLKPEILLYHPFVIGRLTKAVFFASKRQWRESNQYFKEYFERFIVNNPGAFGNLVLGKLYYAWALERQGRLEEANVQLEEAQGIRDETQKRFEHANVRVYLMVRRQAVVGEEFEMRLDLVNAGRRTGVLVRVNGIIPTEFKVSSLPPFCSEKDGPLEIKEKNLDPFQVVTIKLKLIASKAASYALNPEVFYEDDLGKPKAFKLDTITISVKSANPEFEALPGRVNTGTLDLDRLLLGGIPEEYSIVLTAPSSDKRQQLIKRFLEAGAKANETTLLITCESGKTQDLAKQFQANFSMLVCHQQADLIVQNLPNIYKLKGIENLTDIDIALTKYFRIFNKTSHNKPKIACIDLISDVLLQHHAVVTRKWLSGVLSTLKSKGFTTLAVIDPRMHQQEDVQAILGLFDGEIKLSEREGVKGSVTVLKILKLYNQNYSREELTLS